MRSNPVDVRRWIRTPFCRGAFQHRPIAGRTLRRARKNTTPVATGSHFPLMTQTCPHASARAAPRQTHPCGSTADSTAKLNRLPPDFAASRHRSGPIRTLYRSKQEKPDICTRNSGQTSGRRIEITRLQAKIRGSESLAFADLTRCDRSEKQLHNASDPVYSTNSDHKKTLWPALPSVSVCLHEGLGRRNENASIRVNAYMSHGLGCRKGFGALQSRMIDTSAQAIHGEPHTLHGRHA